MKINVGQILSGFLVFFVAVIEVILALRFVLMLLGASRSAEFTGIIYETSDPLAAPFSGVFPSFEAANFTLEISTVLAMIVYGVFGGIFLYLAKSFGSVTVKSHDGNKPMVEPVGQVGFQQQYQQPIQMPVAQVPQYQQPVAQPAQPSYPQPQVQQQYQQPATQSFAQPPLAGQPMNQPINPAAPAQTITSLNEFTPMNPSETPQSPSSSPLSTPPQT